MNIPAGVLTTYLAITAPSSPTGRHERRFSPGSPDDPCPPRASARLAFVGCMRGSAARGANSTARIGVRISANAITLDATLSKRTHVLLSDSGHSRFYRDRREGIHEVADPAALPAPGPVFIHRARCARYDGARLPEALHPLPLALEGYGADGVLFVQRRVGTSTFEAVLEGIFEPAEVQYAHLRNAEAGCFIARIDRLGD